MSKQITVKYFSDFYQYEEYLPYQASEDAAGYDAFVAETKIFLSKSVDSISLEMIWAIPSGFYGKFFPRSGILRGHLVTVEAGVIDSDFRGDVKVFLFNHHPEKTFTVRAGDRIAQVAFMEIFTATFQRVTDKHLLGITKSGSDGFGSTGVSVIEKKPELVSKEVSSEENLQIIIEKTDDEMQTTSEEFASSKEPQITYEEAIRISDNKVVVHELITVSD